MKVTISKENYLKAIAEAEAEGEPVIAATLARWLNVSPPAVTMALRRLKRDDCISIAQDGRISLSAQGRTIADRILRRHHLIERMLTEVFAMDWFKVHDEAEQMEHAVSAEFERLLTAKLGVEDACPHGNRAGLESALERRKRGWKPLAEAAVSERATVVSVYERDRTLLERVDALGLAPGSRFTVLGLDPDGSLQLETNGRTASIGRPDAEKVWVA